MEKVVKIISIMTVLVLVLSTAYASSEVYTPIEMFFKNSPDEKMKYKEIYPTSYEVMENEVYSIYYAKKHILNVVKESFPNSKDLTDYISNLNKLVEEDKEDKLKNLKGFKNELNTEDKFLYEFVYQDETMKESGLLIISKNGVLKKRMVYTHQEIKASYPGEE